MKASALCLLLCAMVLGSSARAQVDADISPFLHFDDVPGVLGLAGEIDIRAPLAFKRALNRYPETSILVLHSPGGLIQSALLIAEEVHERQISTAILSGHECASACAIIFFGGSERLAEGKLGVHQMSGNMDLQGAQLNLSDVLQALTKFGVHPEVITKMLRTPPEDMYFFSDSEKVSFGISGAAFAPLALPKAPVPGPAPNRVEAAGVDERNAQSFVLDLIRQSTSEPAKMLRFSSAVYASEVEFFGKRMSKTEVLEDKSRYAERWPLRSSLPDMNSIRTNCRDGFCQVSGSYRWIVQNPSRNRQLSGLAEFFYVLDMSDVNPVVVSEGGQVLSRD